MNTTLLGFKSEKELMEKVKKYCKQNKITQSDFLKQAVNSFLNDVNNIDEREKIIKGIFIATITNSFLFSEQFNLPSAALKRAKERAEKEYSEITE